MLSKSKEFIEGYRKLKKYNKYKSSNSNHKNHGFLMIEILISIFLFSILIFVISIFLKRVIIIESIKKNTQKQDEYIYYAMENIMNIVKNRDKVNFLFSENEIYANSNFKNIFINEDKIVLRKDNLFYKIEIRKNKNNQKNKELVISDGEKQENMGSKTKLAEYEDISFSKIDNLLFINIKDNELEISKIINLGNEYEEE